MFNQQSRDSFQIEEGRNKFQRIEESNKSKIIEEKNRMQKQKQSEEQWRNRTLQLISLMKNKEQITMREKQLCKKIKEMITK